MIWVKPPVSAGFSDEVGLIEDVDNAGLDAITVAGAGGGSQKKAESVVSASERNQSHQLCSKK